MEEDGKAPNERATLPPSTLHPPPSPFPNPACYTAGSTGRDSLPHDRHGRTTRMDAKASLGEPRVLISRGAILHNVRVLRRALAGPGVKVCAIVKADAYGHGARSWPTRRRTSPARRSRARPSTRAVATIDEAAELPSPSQLPILVFRPIENLYLGRQRQAVEQAVRNGWVLTVCAPSAADDLARVAVACGRRANVQVMVDTGMTRSGVCAGGCEDLLRKIESRDAAPRRPRHPLRPRRRARQRVHAGATPSLPPRYRGLRARPRRPPPPPRRQLQRDLRPPADAPGHGAPRHQPVRHRPGRRARARPPAAPGDEVDGPARERPRRAGRRRRRLRADVEGRARQPDRPRPGRLRRRLPAQLLRPRRRDDPRRPRAPSSVG